MVRSSISVGVDNENDCFNSRILRRARSLPLALRNHSKHTTQKLYIPRYVSRILSLTLNRWTIGLFLLAWIVHTIDLATFLHQLEEIPSLSFNLVTNEPVYLTIIILTYKKREAFLDLLRSIKNQTTTFRYEIIIADNGCMNGLKFDIRSTLTSSVPFRLMRSTPYYEDFQYLPFCDNPGYSIGNNRAAAKAANTSKLILFLNDDLFLRDTTFLQSMVDMYTLQVDTAGGVGCVLLNADGSEILEAGSMVWSDGSTMGYGRGRNDFEASGELQYARPVDYVSGACLMIDRNILSVTGGFDAQTYSAYYEDTDLQMKIQHLYNKWVWLQPRAVALHNEHGSFGSTSVRLMMESHEIFKKRWKQDFLSKHLYPGPLEMNPTLQAMRASDLRGRTTSKQSPTILYIDVTIPSKFHDDDDIAKHSYESLIALKQQGLRVTLFVLLDPMKRVNTYDNQLNDRKQFLQQSGIEVFDPNNGPESLRKLLIDRNGFYNIVVINSVSAYHALNGVLVGLNHDDELFDIMKYCAVIFSSSHLRFHREEAEYKLLNELMNTDVKAPGLTNKYMMYDSLSSTSYHEHQEAELAIIKNVDAAVIASVADKNVIDNYLSRSNEIIGNNHSDLANSKVCCVLNFDSPPSSSDASPPFEERHGILFVGSFTNHSMYGSGDSIWYFLNFIYPMIVMDRPDISVTIVGQQIPHTLDLYVQTMPVNDKVILVHNCHNEKEYYDRARVVIAPDLYGSTHHTRKTLNALAAGVPVVISVAAEQELGPWIKSSTCLGASPESFKSCVLMVHDDKTEWTNLRLNAVELAENVHKNYHIFEQWQRALNLAIETREQSGSGVYELGTGRISGPGSAICLKIDKAYLERYIDAKKAVDDGTYSDGVSHFLSQSPNAGYIYNLDHEAKYLNKHPLLKVMIKNGKFKSGWHHFQTICNSNQDYIYSPDDENSYLTRYPDVAKAVKKNVIKSAWMHFFNFGRNEGRVYGCY